MKKVEKKQSTSKATAIGEFLGVCGKLDTGVRGGRQKLQRIVGKDIFFQSGTGKWFYNTDAIRKMTIKQLNELTDKIKEATHSKTKSR